MCGIAGIISRDPVLVSPKILAEMIARLRHRGPDGQDIWISQTQDGKWIGLGHTRLAIIDLSESGKQPMSNEDGTVWTVFNGEIYNFPELRTFLRSEGHVFRSRTDTEVLVHLYEKKGIDLLADLRGMFAFAIWDVCANRLILARDRLGKKPIFYFHREDLFIFASEAKAILTHPAVKAEVDVASIPYFLTYQYVPSPLSSFKGMRKLSPAHYLVFEGDRITTRRYWALNFSAASGANSSAKPEKKWTESILETLEEAVRLRLTSDVPLGAFLSGGIDSSAVVAMMAKLLSGRVKTFSIGFDEDRYNETNFARKVAAKFCTEHHEFVVHPQALEVLPKLVWHYDEPFGDSSALPTYYVCKLTREHVKVALNGDAGDENFAGYERYVAMSLSQSLDRFSLTLRRALARIVRSVGAWSDGPLFPKTQRFAGILELEPLQKYIRLISHFHKDTAREVCDEDFWSSCGGEPYEYILNLASKCTGSHMLDTLLYIDFHSYLPEDLLVKVDRASMANSLEARSPFLDHKLVELAAMIPADLKLKGVKTKYILKQALGPILPGEILHRKKMGFGLPIDEWFRSDLYESARDLFLSQRFRERGYFRHEHVRNMLHEHKEGRRNWHYHLWDLMMLELWHREFIDNATRIQHI